MNINRRVFGLGLGGSLISGMEKRVQASAKIVDSGPRILLRSSWQTVNIGDIAHTPGVIALLEKHFPEAKVTLWPSSVADGVESMLRRRFPELAIVKTAQEITNAISSHDFLLHGSGPSLVAERDVSRWLNETGKPFGVFGITVTDLKESTANLLSKSKFVFFRDSVSLQHAKDKGVNAPVMEFGPDGAFAVDLANESKANAFLKENGLEKGKFLVCIPRLRFTPYWKIKNQPFNEVKHARNESMKEHDMKPLRDTIQAVINETEMQVLLCPEDRSQMQVGKEMLYDKLPADIQKRVVWRDKYWLTDEAVSVYRNSAGLFGLEMHSPIMAVGNGVPAIVCRFAEQTSKGYMWQDIGLGQWLFDFDKEADLEKLQPAVLDLIRNRSNAIDVTAKARENVGERQRMMVERLKNSL